MKRKDYEKMLKKDLVNEVLKLDEFSTKQTLVLNKANKDKAKYKLDSEQLPIKNREIAALKLKLPKAVELVGNDPRDAIITLHEATIKKLAGYLDSFVAASGDFVGGIRAVVNLGDNAFQNIIDEINKKG